MSNPRPARLGARWVTIIFALVILVPAFYGFATKFREFILLYGREDGAFTLLPILNYLLASIGFFLLLCWAALRGMFRNIEAPKYTMLENEKRLDQGEDPLVLPNGKEADADDRI